MGTTEIVSAAVEPVNKLIECVSGAIGKAYEPRHIKKMADAKAYELQILSDVVRNNSDLPIVYNGETAIDISDYEELLKRAGNRLGYQEIVKQENIESIVDQAYDELEGKELIGNENVSRDWMRRYIDAAGDICSTDMQSLWAKILAGEVIEPNSFSLQTLDCLKNLSSKDAALFSKVCQYIISGKLVIGDEKILEKYGVKYDDILYLDDCGLINSSALISLSCQASSTPVPFLDFGEYAVFVRTKEEEKIEITVAQYPLTRTGRELYEIAKNGNAVIHYINDVVEYIQKSNPKCILEIHKVLERNGNGFTYQKEVTVFDNL